MDIPVSETLSAKQVGSIRRPTTSQRRAIMAAIHGAERAYTALGQTEVIVLNYGDVYRLPDDVVSIRLLSGTAWVTSQSEDYFLEGADQMRIPRQPYTVLISALHHQSLRFELSKL